MLNHSYGVIMNKLRTIKIYTKKCAYNYCDIRLFAYFKIFKTKCAVYNASGERVATMNTKFAFNCFVKSHKKHLEKLGFKVIITNE